MRLHMHPTRREALTAGETTLTRWSLATNPATLLAHLSTAPESVFDFAYDPYGRRSTLGGVTGTPDGLLFVHEHLQPDRYRGRHPCMLAWRRVEDLSLARTSTVPQACSGIGSLACSPDGRWLVIGPEFPERIFLLDWHSGQVLSHHALPGYWTTGLTFDSTSTFVAGIVSHDACGFLLLWHLKRAEHVVPRPVPEQNRWTRDAFPPDCLSGSMALTLVHGNSVQEEEGWIDAGLANQDGMAAFSPESRLVLYLFHAFGSGRGFELVAFEVASGKQRWRVHGEQDCSGPFVFTPGGEAVLVPVRDGDLLLYRVEDGALLQRLSSGLSEPVQALAFDHDGRTLWLATEEALVQYQPDS